MPFLIFVVLFCILIALAPVLAAWLFGISMVLGCCVIGVVWFCFNNMGDGNKKRS